MNTRVALFLFAFLPFCANAKPAIPPLYRSVATAAGIPAAVLYAVALTESGTRMTSGETHPWPWTLNVAGTPYRFATRREAYQHLDSQLQTGKRNVDIGLAQVNWHYNGHRFPNAWQALDPEGNLTAAATLLRELYEKHGQWGRAVGRYYGASDPTLRARYRVRFNRNFAKWHQ